MAHNISQGFSQWPAYKYKRHVLLGKHFRSICLLVEYTEFFARRSTTISCLYREQWTCGSTLIPGRAHLHTSQGRINWAEQGGGRIMRATRPGKMRGNVLLQGTGEVHIEGNSIQKGGLGFLPQENFEKSCFRLRLLTKF